MLRQCEKNKKAQQQKPSQIRKEVTWSQAEEITKCYEELRVLLATQKKIFESEVRKSIYVVLYVIWFVSVSYGVQLFVSPDHASQDSQKTGIDKYGNFGLSMPQSSSVIPETINPHFAGRGTLFRDVIAVIVLITIAIVSLFKIIQANIKRSVPKYQTFDLLPESLKTNIFNAVMKGRGEKRVKFNEGVDDKNISVASVNLLQSLEMEIAAQKRREVRFTILSAAAPHNEGSFLHEVLNKTPAAEFKKNLLHHLGLFRQPLDVIVEPKPQSPRP